MNIIKYCLSILIVVAIVVACGQSTKKENQTCYYSVFGTANSVFITMENSTGGTEQLTHSVPWSSTTFSVHSGNFLYISAQNQEEQGSITVRIFVNGNMIKESTSSGAYVIASSSYLVP